MIRPATLGDFASEHGQTVNTAVQAGGVAATAVGVATHAAWVPIVGPIVAGVALGLTLIFARKGPKQKEITTQLVNELEPLLAQNRDGYFAGPRTRAAQRASLAMFDEAFAWLESRDACGNPELGNPGKACINDRARGGKWDWYALYRDPIANDPNAIDDPVADALAAVLPGAWVTAGAADYIIPAALILLGLIL